MRDKLRFASRILLPHKNDIAELSVPFKSIFPFFKVFLNSFQINRIILRVSQSFKVYEAGPDKSVCIQAFF